MTCGKQWARCIALVVALWAAWLAALGCSLFLAFCAMTLAGLNSAIAILLVVIGALAALGIDMYIDSKKARYFYEYLANKLYHRDERLSAELGVNVYRGAFRHIASSGGFYSKPYILVYLEGYSEEELKATAYHEYSHIKRRDAIVEAAVKGAAIVSTIVVAFLLTLFGNLGKYSPSDVLAPALAVAGVYLTLWLAGHFSELLADAESALAVGPGPVLSSFVKDLEIERENREKSRRELEKRGVRFPFLYELVHRLLDTHPPAAIRMWLMRLCAR